MSAQQLLAPPPKVQNLIKLPGVRIRVKKDYGVMEGTALHAVHLVEYEYLRGQDGNPLRDQFNQTILAEKGLRNDGQRALPPIGLCFRTDSGHDLYAQPEQIEELEQVAGESLP